VWPSASYTTTSGYLAHRLTGQPKDTAANNILLQWPIDTDSWRWSDDAALYEQLGVTREMLFELQLPGDVIGPLTAAASAATGIPVGLPVVTTANDKAVEALAAGSLGDTTALVSLGTYIAAMVHGRENHPSPTHFWTNFACLPHRYLYESGGVRRGMWTLTWFLDLLGEEVAERAATLGLTREQYLEREAEAVPAGSDGLMTVLDWLAPTDSPFRKGVMLGFDARHTRGHVYRSILEAIALTMKHNVDAMCGELGIELDEIVVSGGGAQSRLFMQIFADVFGIRASRSVENGGASLGAAICAAAAAGLYPDIEAAAARMTHERESFEPDPANAGVYRRMNETVYPTIRNATDPLLQQSFPIFH
jgi:sugar (pentulose or hexulose) kinase